MNECASKLNWCDWMCKNLGWNEWMHNASGEETRCSQNGLAECENKSEQLAWIKVGKQENCKWMRDTISNEWAKIGRCVAK